MAVTPKIAQRDDVLARTAKLRRAIEALVASVADGSTSLSRALELGDQDPVARFVYLVKIVEAVPGIGKVRARRALESLGYGERTRAGEVPVHARAALVGALA